MPLMAIIRVVLCRSQFRILLRTGQLWPWHVLTPDGHLGGRPLDVRGTLLCDREREFRPDGKKDSLSTEVYCRARAGAIFSCSVRGSFVARPHPPQNAP